MINILNLGLKESLGITFEDDILREKCSNAVFFSGPCSVQIQENTDQKNLRVWTLSTQCHASNCV